MATAPDTWFENVEPTQRATLAALRKLVRSVEPQAVEEIKWGRPCYSNAKGMFCYLHSTKTHATLGFQKGAELSDPERLLQGTGKAMRHIKFKRGGDEEETAVVALLKQAAAL